MKLTLLAVSLGVVTVSACSSTGSTTTRNPESFIYGKVTRSVFQSDQVEVARNGKVYRGEWVVKPPTADQKTPGEGYRHVSHLGNVNSILTADDGSAIECQWKTHLRSAEGNCTIEGRKYVLDLK